jgi:hypothetical protein
MCAVVGRKEIKIGCFGCLLKKIKLLENHIKMYCWVSNFERVYDVILEQTAKALATAYICKENK